MSLNLSIILLLSTIIGFGVAQSTVPTGNGLSFQCPTNPSPIPAFAAGYCASSLTHKTGAQWPLMSEVVTVTYSQAPGSYFSNAAGDIYLVCNWQDPAGAINNFGCRYNAGAATGDSFAAGLQYNAGGTGFNQKCPVIQAKKPIPSPGLQYRKRLLPVTTFTCPTIQQGGSYYLSTTQYSLSNTAQAYTCNYRTGTPAQIQCRYDANGQLIPPSATVPPNVNCPLTQCQATQPYSRRRGLPQPADRRQTSRERIIARQKEILERSADQFLYRS